MKKETAYLLEIRKGIDILSGEKYREQLIKLVKASGQEVIDRAEELVGDGELLTDFTIQLLFPQDSVPTIYTTREYISKKAMEVLRWKG